jgi:hypothetical protein
MGPDNWVTTVIRSDRHNRECPAICVRVDREVPLPLHCSPGGGNVGGETVSASDCPCGGRFDTGDLGRRVADALRRGLGEWIRRGAVVIDC